MLGDAGAPPDSSRPADEALMDAHKQIECEMESKTVAFLKEGLDQQSKTDTREKATAETRDWLNSMPHKGTDNEDEGSDPGSDRNEEGRKQGLEYTDLEDKGYDVEITDTEASEGLLYEEVATLLSKSAQRKERRQALLEQKKKQRARIDPSTTKAVIDEIVTKAYSRCSVPYFSEIVDFVCKSNRRVQLVRNSDFGYLLELVDCPVPRGFVQWIADNVDTEGEAIVLNKKSIPLNAQSVEFVLGIPSGDTIINTKEEEAGKQAFLALFGLTEVPTIKFFGNKLLKEDLSDNDFIRCFMVVALATFLCPTSNTKPSTKYMGALVNVEELKQLNWCRFVHEWELMYIKKYQKEKLKQNRTTMTLGGCIYHLAVRCLDFTDFGSIQIPSLMPRICVWKGEMIKHLSDMTIGKDGKYGALAIKEVSETCYKDGTNEWASTIKNSNFRKAIKSVAGIFLSDKVKEDIFLAFETHMKNEDINSCTKAKGLLLDTIRIIANASGESGDTVKVGSTGNEFIATQESNKSGDTVKLQSTEVEEENDGGHLAQRKRRKTNVLSTSQQSACSSAQKTNAGTGRTNEGEGLCSSPPKVQGIDKLKSEFEGQCQRDSSSKELVPEMSVPATSTFVVGNHVHGDTTKKMHSGEAVLLQYKRKTKDDQTSSEPHDSCSIKRKKPLESLLKGDKLASSRKVEEKGEAHTLHNQQEKSSSLDYMLNEETKDKHVQNVAESAKKVIPTELIQSKIISTEAKPTTFSGFQNTPIQELDLESKSFRGRPDKLSIDINVTAQPESDEVFARGYKIISDFLDKAREKYFFADDRTPSFRITEDVDECGNIIEEHELWRPLEMKDECYNNKIESTKIKIARNFKELQSEDFDISAQGNTNLKGSSSLYNELSIQCAQREAQKSLMCETPHTPKPAEEIIDLTSPEVQASTRWNHKQTCYSPWKSNNQWTTETPPLKIKKDYNMVPIIGRRLFPEEESYQQESSGSKGNPIQLMEQKSSGELKILGENSFRQERSTLVNRTDDIYNTSLSLGRPRSFHGKENVPPKRVVQPSRYRSSPYDCDERGPIMAHERKMYEAITSLADVEGSKPAIFIDKTIATYAQLGNSMKIGGRVESYVINVYCRHLFNENHPRNSHKHYFFHTASEYFLAKWKNEEARIWWRHKLITSFIGAGKAHDLSMSDKLYFPTLHEGHYFLFVVDIKGRMFFFLDSYYDENSSYHKNIKNKIISSFICTWYEAQLKPMNFNAFPAVYPKVPQQDNDTDCSIFTMKLMGWCPRNPAPIVFSPKDIPDARIRYAVDLMFSPYNALYEEKKRVKEFRL